MNYTTADAARLLGVARRTLVKHANKLSLAKHGRDYLIDDAALERLRVSIDSAQTGRPKKK